MITPVSNSNIPEPTKLHKKRHPFRVHSEKIHRQDVMPNKEFRARFGKQEMVVEKTVQKFDKELWEAFPLINVVEIRHTNEIQVLTKTLTSIKGKNARVYNLAPYGIDKTIQILGNTYVPIRRSEHQDIQALLRKMSPDLGIQNNKALTFIIVEDALYDNLLTELTKSEKSVLPHKEIKIEEPEEVKKSRPSVVEKRTVKSSQKNVFIEKWKRQAIKGLWDVFAGKFHTKEKNKEKREQELLKEEKCIKYATLQFERLSEMVVKAHSKKEIEKLCHLWDESCPPFPIRSVHLSTLWKEYKTKMIEDLLIKSSRA